jgi:serine/threonine protein kinase
MVSHYRILRKVGGGGMGLVYEAEDLKLGRHVALKFLPTDMSNDPLALKRFEREARAASALNHPNICTIHEIAEFQGQPVIVMELLEGETLQHRISGNPLSPGEVLDISIQLADALETAHFKGILHVISSLPIFLLHLEARQKFSISGWRGKCRSKPSPIRLRRNARSACERSS